MRQAMLDFWPGQLVRTTHFDQTARLLADRHYNRQSPGAPQFAGNGPKLVLRDTEGLVLWVWLNEHQRRWDGQLGYYCQTFRNESARLSSEIIIEAEQHAIARWGLGRMFTYVDPAQIRSTNPGYCYLVAGWHPHGYSKKRGRRLLVKYDGCTTTARPARAQLPRNGDGGSGPVGSPASPAGSSAFRRLQRR